MNLTRRHLFGLISFICISGLIAAFYMEHIMGLNPCPLCQLQRLAMFFSGLFALLAFIHQPKLLGGRIYLGFITLSSCAGIGVAARQLWLQQLPKDQVPACGPGLEYLLDVFPLFEVLQQVLSGSGECAEIAWQLWGISLPGWSAIMFLALLIICGYYLSLDIRHRTKPV